MVPGIPWPQRTNSSWHSSGIWISGVMLGRKWLLKFTNCSYMFIFVSFKQNYHCIIVSIFWIQFGTFFMTRFGGGFPHMLIKGPQKSIGVLKWHWGLGRFSNVLESAQELWQVLIGSQRFWKFPGGSGMFWEDLECSWEFGEVWDASWRISKVLLGCGKSWEVIRSRKSLKVIEISEKMWNVSGCQRFLKALRGSLRLLKVLGGC